MKRLALLLPALLQAAEARPTILFEDLGEKVAIREIVVDPSELTLANSERLARSFLTENRGGRRLLVFVIATDKADIFRHALSRQQWCGVRVLKNN